MIFVTGDTHADFKRFSTRAFPEQKEMTRNDFVIICGDFGGIWKDSPEERHWLNWLNDKPFTTLFVDGNHENHERLNNDFPIQKFAGGNIHWIRSYIFHLMRGEVYEIQGKKFFAFGGASSHDISDGIVDPADFPDERAYKKELWWKHVSGQLFRVKGVSWWPEEMPNESEMQYGIETLAKNDNKVDYVITHCLPQEAASILSMGLYKVDPLTMYFNKLLHDGIQFDKWFCGHYHINQTIMLKFNILYDKIVRIV